jgi:hypothetical protein
VGNSGDLVDPAVPGRGDKRKLSYVMGSSGATPNAELKTAVNLWLSDEAAAEATYGHISTWVTSQVTSMFRLFNWKSTFNADISSWDGKWEHFLLCLIHGLIISSSADQLLSC